MNVTLTEPNNSLLENDARLEDACIHVIDDDEHFRTSLRLLLASRGMKTETYRSGEHFLSIYRPHRVECLLLDLRMPGLGGIELQEELQRRHIQLPTIVISAFAETPSVVATIRNGAVDFLEKPIEEVTLIEKVQKALERDRLQKGRQGELRGRLCTLTDREREVMDCFLAARTTIQSARDLVISPKTVEKHRLKIYDKLGVGSIPELMRLMASLKE